MNLHFSKKQMGITVLAIVLIGTLFFGAYFFYLKPVNDKLDRKQTELKMASQELTIIENKLRQTNEQTVLNSLELQKQVPVKRLLDQLMLDIEKAEIISDTNIIEIKLNGTEKDEELDIENTADLDENQKENSSDDDSGESNTSDQVDASQNSLPTGIKKVSLSLNGEAETYFEMEKFITSLESLERIIKIDTFNFTGLDEVYSVEQDFEKVEFELSLAAYYYPKLEELQDELPSIDTPDVSNKRNPLNNFSTINEDEQP